MRAHRLTDAQIKGAIKTIVMAQLRGHAASAAYYAEHPGPVSDSLLRLQGSTSRCMYLAYGFLRGAEVSEIESEGSFTPPDWIKVYQIVHLICRRLEIEGAESLDAVFAAWAARGTNHAIMKLMGRAKKPRQPRPEYVYTPSEADLEKRRLRAERRESVPA